jgi:DNA-binding MarR family transcriptional regulator
MPTSGAPSDVEKTRILLGLLESVERDGGQSQRRLASELGIALGLVNAYLKRCVTKGLVKVQEVPARRFGYFLTPQGFAEKSRLTVEYLSYSFSFFREAKADCADLLADAQARGLTRLVAAGKSDLAEIAGICAMDTGAQIVAVVDAAANVERFIGLPVVNSFDAVRDSVDAVIVTDLLTPHETSETALAHFGFDRVLIPRLLRMRMRKQEEELQS